VPAINPENSGTATLTHREDILLQPLADRSGTLGMITNNVPGTFVMHDHLHSRGGHGVIWQIDGVPVPNSNLASSGAQFDPKDISSLETKRGGLSADLGDRSYGVFNVVPRSGFEGDRFGEASAGYGSFHRLDGYVSVGDHSEDHRFAYFASGNGNRTDLGLERVDVPILHDRGKAARDSRRCSTSVDRPTRFEPSDRSASSVIRFRTSSNRRRSASTTIHGRRTASRPSPGRTPPTRETC
jgi:hypothetical protein